MTDFSNNDLDRAWSRGELTQLSERDLTTLSFFRNLKNLIFFAVGAIIVWYLVARLGTVGKVIGWIAILVYGLFALEPLFGFVTTLISLFASSSGRSWKFIQMLISGLSAILYAGLAMLIYLGMNRLK